MVDCGSCSDPLPDDNEFAVCSVCKANLHFTCADILESTWNRMGQTRRDNWKCSKCSGCKSKAPKDTSTKIPVDKSQEQFLAKMEETIKAQFSRYEENFGAQLNEFRNSMDFFSNKIDDYECQIKTYCSQVKDLQDSQNMLVKENEKLKKEIAQYKSQLEDLEQYNRNKNIQIDGVPEIPNENVGVILQKISHVVGLPLNITSDIQAMHRIPTKRERGPKPIIVQFSNRQTRDEFLSKCKKTKITSIDFAEHVPQTNVYVNEHLTPYNKSLLFNAKKLKERGWKFIWIKEGKIFARKDDGGKRIRLTSLEHIDKLLKPSE
jgi:regulator of replication initiation timing